MGTVVYLEECKAMKLLREARDEAFEEGNKKAGP